MKNAWRADRKPANVLLVLDTSGSMNDEGRLASAKDGLQTFLKEVAPQDRVGLTIFNDRVTEVAPITPIREIRASLRGVVSRLIADGGTAIYDATDAGVAHGQEARRHEPYQRRRPADRRRGHRLVEDRRVGRARARRAGRLVAPRARVHDRLLGRRGGRRGEARADRRRRRAARPTRATPTTSNRSTAASARSSTSAADDLAGETALQPRRVRRRARRQRGRQAVQHRAAGRHDGGAGRCSSAPASDWCCSSRSSSTRSRRRGRSSTRRRPRPCSRACAPSAAPR